MALALSIPSWTLAITGWVLAALGLAVAAWALFWDRARGRRRCPRCWYDMAGVVGLRCPECGREAKRERGLAKTRRRWAWLGASVLLWLGGYGASVVPRVRADGWIGAIPTWAMITFAPVDRSAWNWTGMLSFPAEWPQPATLFTQEIRHRLPTMSTIEKRVLLSRFLGANPGQRRWIAFTRNRWPSGKPIHIQTHYVPLMPTRDAVLTVRLAGCDAEWTTLELTEDGFRSMEIAPPPRDGIYKLECVVRGKPGGGVLWRGSLGSINVGGTAAEMLTPLASEEADREVSRLEPLVYIDSSTKQPVLRIHLSGYHLGGGGEVDWSLGMRCVLRHDGVEFAAADVRYPMAEPGMIVDYMTFYTTFPLRWTRDPPETPLTGDWELELTGDPDVAIRDLLRDTYWSGRVTGAVARVPRLDPDEELGRRLREILKGGDQK